MGQLYLIRARPASEDPSPQELSTRRPLDAPHADPELVSGTPVFAMARGGPSAPARLEDLGLLVLKDANREFKKLGGALLFTSPAELWMFAVCFGRDLKYAHEAFRET